MSKRNIKASGDIHKTGFVDSIIILIIFAMAVVILGACINGCENAVIKYDISSKQNITMTDGSISTHIFYKDYDDWMKSHKDCQIIAVTPISNKSYGHTGEYIIIYKKGGTTTCP